MRINVNWTKGKKVNMTERKKVKKAHAYSVTQH